MEPIKFFFKLYRFIIRNRLRCGKPMLGVLAVLVFAAIAGDAFAVSKAYDAYQLAQTGNSQKAWEMISAEMANPSVTSQGELCQTHAINLILLSIIVKTKYSPADPDILAKISYDYAILNCDADKSSLGSAIDSYGLYFEATNRIGLSIPYYLKARQISPELSMNRPSTEAKISNVYWAMGNPELAEHYTDSAITMAKRYFESTKMWQGQYKGQEYIAYMDILFQKMRLLSLSVNPSNALPQMREIWKEIEVLNDKWVAKIVQSAAINRATNVFASSGDTEFARKLLSESIELTNKYPSPYAEKLKRDALGSEAQILKHEGKFDKAASVINDLHKRTKTTKKLILQDYIFAGIINESAGNYDLAVDLLEKAMSELENNRSSFDMASRTRFFSNDIANTYVSLIRSYAARYIKNGTVEDLKNALRTEGMLRARQFGELKSVGGKVSQPSTSQLKLKPDELLLDYVLTDKAIIIFAISSAKTNLAMIPYNAKEFNALASRVKSNLLSHGDTKKINADLLTISNTVLKPVEKYLRSKKKIIVISDGYLSSIPFGLISRSGTSYYPIIKDYEVLMMPSISYLIAERNGPNRKIAYQKELFAVADPLFGTVSVPEIYRGDGKELIYTRAINDMNVFTPLPETKTEVQKISEQLLPGTSSILVGTYATKTNVKKQKLIGYRYLHFATHGVLGNQIPGVDEPAIVLSREQGKDDDMFLRLSEIEKLKINSELTVLSACDTGSGKYYTGEGIMGLSRGFLLAGSRSVLATLWPIDSQATVKFMVLFYKYLKSGKSKPESLRLTQLDFMKSDDTGNSSPRGLKATDRIVQDMSFAHPYYWAAFVLTGE